MKQPAMVQAEQVRLLYDQAPLGLGLTLVVSLILGTFLLNEVSVFTVGAWWLATAIVVAWRWRLVCQFRSATAIDSSLVAWSHRFVFGATLAGLAWGVGGAALAFQVTLPHQALIIVVIGAMVAAAIPFLGSVVAAYVGYLLGAALPVLVWLFWQQSFIHTVIAVLTCVFMAGTWGAVRRLSRLQEKNSALAAELKATNESLEKDTVIHRKAESQLIAAARIAKLGHWHLDEVAQEYLDISEEYARIFGYTVEEFLEQFRTIEQDTELVHPEDREKLLGVYEVGDDTETDYRIVRADGEVRHVREIIECHLRDETGRAIESVGTLQDITELKEAQLVAEAASCAKSEFLSRMSHELRTPMNAILGFGQLLQSTPPKQLEKQQQFVAHILDAGQHLLTLIDEVLDLARIESGRTQMFMEAVHPGEVLEECTKLTESLVEKSSVTIENRVAVNGAPAVWADRTRLKEVLLNLITNAVKYNRAEGRVTLSCEQPRAGMLHISVSDTGLGIPEARIGELFEPFSRLHEAQSEVEGTGIGLTITKRLVELMGGKLGVESTLGEGSTFWVELELDSGGAVVPGRRETELAPVEARPIATDPSRRLALYIEDDPASLALMGEALKRQLGAVLLDAPNAELGLEIARSKRPDVILMDINLPGMNGIEALITLKADKATREIPVIAVSARAMPRDIERGRTAGFFDYLTKPVDLKLLNDALDRALHKDA